MYTKEQKREIERVLLVFKPYLEHADFLDYLWAEKPQQFVYLFLDRARNSIEEAEYVDSARMICEQVYWEMGNDVLLEHDCDDPVGVTPKAVQDEFLKAVEPYDAQLPEYHDVIQQLLSQPAQAE